MKKAAIIASFGTSYTETRKKTLDTIEAEARTLFTDIEIFRAYTSAMVRKIFASARARAYTENIFHQGFSRIMFFKD